MTPHNLTITKKEDILRWLRKHHDCFERYIHEYRFERLPAKTTAFDKMKSAQEGHGRPASDGTIESSINTYFGSLRYALKMTPNSRFNDIAWDNGVPWRQREGLLKDYLLAMLHRDPDKMRFNSVPSLLEWFNGIQAQFRTQLWRESLNKAMLWEYMTAKQRVRAYRCSAFIDYMKSASPEERVWVRDMLCKRSQVKHNYKQWSWTFGADFILLMDENVCNVLDVDRKGNMTRHNATSNQMLETICSYPWTHRDDHSIEWLTRDALICIYDYLTDPRDMRHFMMVNRAFHDAGEAYGGYKRKIAKLLAATQLAEPPLLLFSGLRKQFFAMCFVSCLDDREFEKRLVRYINYEEKHDDSLVCYCQRLSSDAASLSTEPVLGPVYASTPLSVMVDGDPVLHATDEKQSRFYRIKDRVREILME